jgi:hypothetical protein
MEPTHELLQYARGDAGGAPLLHREEPRFKAVRLVVSGKRSD